jgi:hypothetical protein
MFGYRSILQEQARSAAIRESRRAPWLAPAGRLGDAVGRKLVYTYGFAVFTVASAACGLAPSLGALVALRLIQAIGAAMLQANSVALVTTSALLAALAIAGAAAFIRREARTGHPLIPVWLLRSRPLALALAGAACGYLTLFGPLVLIPQVLTHGGRAARTGLLLSALPLGFGLAELVGLGLGIFVPANNTVIMRSTADSSASLVGGLVSMARGIGTTFGISLMALALHLGTQSSQAGNHGYAAHHGYPGAEQARPAFIVLAAVAAMAAAIALAGQGRRADR